MGFSIFEDEILGHSHLIKVENHEKLIENIEMRGSDCDFWIFQAFSDKYPKSFRVQSFVPPFPEAFKDSRLKKSLSTFYESLKKYGAKNIKKVIDLHSEYVSIIHI